MSKKNILLAAALAATTATGAFASVVNYGTNTFDGGWASWIEYDDAANRGTSSGRDNPANALGSNASDFFEIGFGSTVDLKFGTMFQSPGTLIEVTGGSASAWPESVDIFVGVGGVFTSVGSMDNTAAQAPGGEFTFLAGNFDTIRLVDTSSYPASGSGGWDIGAVRVSPVPLPAAGFLLLAGLGGLGALRRKKKS